MSVIWSGRNVCQHPASTAPQTLCCLCSAWSPPISLCSFAWSTRRRSHCCVMAADLFLLPQKIHRRQDLIKRKKTRALTVAPDNPTAAMFVSCTNTCPPSTVCSAHTRGLCSEKQTWRGNVKGVRGLIIIQAACRSSYMSPSWTRATPDLNTVWEDFIIETCAVVCLRGLPTLPRKINWSSHITSLSTFLPTHSPFPMERVWWLRPYRLYYSTFSHRWICQSICHPASVPEPRWDLPHSDKYRFRDSAEGLLQEDSDKHRWKEEIQISQWR